MIAQSTAYRGRPDGSVPDCKRACVIHGYGARHGNAHCGQCNSRKYGGKRKPHHASAGRTRRRERQRGESAFKPTASFTNALMDMDIVFRLEIQRSTVPELSWGAHFDSSPIYSRLTVAAAGPQSRLRHMMLPRTGRLTPKVHRRYVPAPTNAGSAVNILIDAVREQSGNYKTNQCSRYCQLPRSPG